MTTAGDQSKPKARPINILKGPSFDNLAPLVVINVLPDVEDLSDMRTMLARFKYMSSTDSFLHSSRFPIHKEDEPGFKLDNALFPYKALTERGSNGQAQTGTKDNKVDSKNLLIFSRSSSNFDQPAEIPEQFKFTDHDKGKTGEPQLNKGDVELPKPPRLEKAKGADKAINAKILNKEQVDDVFDINNVFGGVSFIGPIGATAQIFEPPKDLSRLIWVCDDSTIEIQSFEYSIMNSMFKQGAWGLSAQATYKGAVLGAGGGSKFKYEARSVQTSKWVTGVYRFPRAVIRLPIATMQPTERFKSELAAVFAGKDDNLKGLRLQDFFREYGQAFAFELQLGGHLHTTLTEGTSETSSKESSESQIRAGFSYLGFGISGNKSKGEGQENEEKRSHASLVVEAIGGDTLLSSNLELWPASVMPHTNWRITRRSDIQSLIDIPSLFSVERKKEVERLFGPFSSLETHMARAKATTLAYSVTKKKEEEGEKNKEAERLKSELEKNPKDEVAKDAAEKAKSIAEKVTAERGELEKQANEAEAAAKKAEMNAIQDIPDIPDTGGK